jgi:hypothetical protein
MEATTRGGQSGPERLAERASESASELKRTYAHGEDKPLGSHFTLVVIYNALVGGFLLARA